MGQAATKERHGQEDHPSGVGPSGSSSSTTHARQQQQRLQKSYPSSIDGGALTPQGVYEGDKDYDHDVVKTAIVKRKLMPFYKGADDEATYSSKPFNTECPICFLFYPSPLNMTRCCAQPICSECFVQMKRPDPTLTNPPSTHPPECPYCTAENFGIVYTKPSISPIDESTPPASPDSPSSREQSTSISHNKRKSFSHTDREVLTVGELSRLARLQDIPIKYFSLTSLFCHPRRCDQARLDREARSSSASSAAQSKQEVDHARSQWPSHPRWRIVFESRRRFASGKRARGRHRLARR